MAQSHAADGRFAVDSYYHWFDEAALIAVVALVVSAMARVVAALANRQERQARTGAKPVPPEAAGVPAPIHLPLPALSAAAKPEDAI